MLNATKFWLTLTAAISVAIPALAAEQFPAVLAGHAVIPAQTFVPPPADAPALFATSGKFTADNQQRVDRLYSLPGISFLSDAKAPRYTGISRPFVGQPVQGFSGIKALGNGEFLALVDNGFGSKSNSPDAMLMVHRIKPDWASGRVEILETLFLHDPDRVIPFPIMTESSTTRYLTGADFDLESLQPVSGKIWFGDEFGPYLVVTDMTGKILACYETQVAGKTVRSPDHYRQTLPAVPGEVTFEVRRSRGFEGMAASPDGRFLYPLFEGPLWDSQTKAFENKDGREFLRMVQFDMETGKFTDRQWRYLLEANGNNIGDFNMIDNTRALIIERDNGEGDSALACRGEITAQCFNKPAQFKRVYLVDFAQADSEGFVRKIGYIDLLDIADPQGVARINGKQGRFSFPFVTIENVDRVDAQHIIVANDNNLPFSSGRALGQQDNNEFMLLNVQEMLRAR